MVLLPHVGDPIEGLEEAQVPTPVGRHQNNSTPPENCGRSMDEVAVLLLVLFFYHNWKF